VTSCSISPKRTCGAEGAEGPDAHHGLMVLIISVAAFGTSAISFWPYMMPGVITINEAAAPHSSLTFMFWGERLFVLPLMLVSTLISYRLFRG
jgi:cytochrome d ubiquinol oxidase subunit II